jgi:hypothetical protein
MVDVQSFIDFSLWLTLGHNLPQFLVIMVQVLLIIVESSSWSYPWYFRWCWIVLFVSLVCRFLIYLVLIYSVWFFAGLYSTFVPQKPDPDAMPPIVTPDLHDPDNAQEQVCLPALVAVACGFLFSVVSMLLCLTPWFKQQEWPRGQQASTDDGRRPHVDVILPLDPEKGILGPGPVDMRL